MSSLKQKNKITRSNENLIILHIETSTNICSVALSKGEQLLALKESEEDKAHARLLSIFIKQVFEESKLKIEDINAISISMGPGSYTGLRIGVSTAKGLCYGLNIPLIAINTLELLSCSAINSPFIKNEIKYSDFLCPMIDARRMEVYTCLFNPLVNKIGNVSAEIIFENSFIKELENHRVFFFGNGADKCKNVINHKNAIFIDEIKPSAQSMIKRSLIKYKNKSFVNLPYFEPLYLKDFVPTISKKKFL